MHSCEMVPYPLLSLTPSCLCDVDSISYYMISVYVVAPSVLSFLYI